MGKHYYAQGHSRRHNRLRPLLLVVLGIILVAGLGFGGYKIFSKDAGTDKVTQNNVQSSPVEKPSEPQPKAVHGRYLFNGTIVLARMVERAAGQDLAKPFSQMSTFEPQKYDTMTLDWECPTTEDIIPYETQVSNLLFNCHKKWLPEVSKLFGIVSLANNHSGDLGQAAFKATQKNLEEAGIQTYGNYNPAVKEDVCEIIALPVRLRMPDNSEQKATLPMAFCAWHYFFRTPQPGEIEGMEEYAKLMPVFGFMHAGAEYFAKAAPDQERIAKQIIDNGAEFVIGNSPHWVQNGEVYKNKPIFYSTGNFIFDQIDAETMRGLSIDVSMEVPYSDNVARWLAIGESCKARADTCLETAQSQHLAKYPIKLTYDVVGSAGGSRKITKKADAALQKSIEARVGWDSMKQQLGQ